MAPMDVSIDASIHRGHSNVPVYKMDTDLVLMELHARVSLDDLTQVSCAITYHAVFIIHALTSGLIFLWQKLMNVLKAFTIVIKHAITLMDHSHAHVAKVTSWQETGLHA